MSDGRGFELSLSARRGYCASQRQLASATQAGQVRWSIAAADLPRVDGATGGLRYSMQSGDHKKDVVGDWTSEPQAAPPCPCCRSASGRLARLAGANCILGIGAAGGNRRSVSVKQVSSARAEWRSRHGET